MNDRPSNSRKGIGDAAWAYNRWPTIGLFTGIGIGVVLGVSFPLGWILGILVALAGGGVGCVLGLILAKLIYGRASQRDDDQP